MKVILLADVKNVGKKGEIVEVANGYANNFLIRNRKAVAYSKGSMNVLQRQKDDAAKAEKKAKNKENKNSKKKGADAPAEEVVASQSQEQ